MKIINKIFQVKNLNSRNRYFRQYSFLFIRIKKKNLKKYEFYEKKYRIAGLKKYNENKLKLEELKKYREHQNYILTCYIVTYNHGSSIRKAIESVLNQETQYNYLIKILDDCSTDKTTDVCMEFAEKYPEKIQLIIQPENTKGKHASSFFRSINTKYFSILDGDDYWCDKSKIEKAINFLEKNNEYVMWGHDTLWYNPKTKIQRSYVHEDQGIKTVNNPVTYDNYVYTALSARFYRNIIDFKKEYIANHMRDIFIYYLFLDKGPLYYHDEIMSVYVFNNKGVFSSLHTLERAYSRIYSFYKINKYLEYRHDKYFTDLVKSARLKICKKIFGCKLGWLIYLIFKRQKFLRKFHKDRCERFKQIEYGHNLFTNEEVLYLDELARGQQ